MNLTDGDTSWVGAVRAGTSQTILNSPAWMIGKAVAGVWFNPATDENIMEPLTTAGEQMNLRPPNEALWLYSRTVTAQLPDTGTTVTAIRAWED